MAGREEGDRQSIPAIEVVTKEDKAILYRKIPRFRAETCRCGVRREE